MSNVPSSIQSSKLSAFVDACLEPLPNHLMLDTAHNRELRRSAYNSFIIAQRKYKYYRSLMDANDAIAPYEWYPAEKQAFPHLVTWPKRSVIHDHYRDALLACLLTLTGETTHIEWKRRRIKRRWGLPTDISEIEAAIARDEAFKAAHPVQRKGW